MTEGERQLELKRIRSNVVKIPSITEKQLEGLALQLCHLNKIDPATKVLHRIPRDDGRGRVTEVYKTMTAQEDAVIQLLTLYRMLTLFSYLEE